MKKLLLAVALLTVATSAQAKYKETDFTTFEGQTIIDPAKLDLKKESLKDAGYILKFAHECQTSDSSTKIEKLIPFAEKVWSEASVEDQNEIKLDIDEGYATIKDKCSNLRAVTEQVRLDFDKVPTVLNAICNPRGMFENRPQNVPPVCPKISAAPSFRSEPIIRNRQLPTAPTPVRYYNGRGDLIGTASSFTEFLNIAEKGGNRVSLLTPKMEAENLVEHLKDAPKTFATVVFSKEDCRLVIHPMLETALKYVRTKEPVQLATEVEALRVTASFARGSFCNVARAGIEDITSTFDNLLFTKK